MPWIERVRDSQPIDAGIGLDGSNPITRELRLAWRGGNRIDDAMGDVASSVGTITNTLSRHGAGISPALNSYLSFPAAPSLNILGDITCLAIFSPSAVASDTSIVSNAFSNGGTYTPFDFGQNSAKLKLGRAGYNAGNYYRVWAAGTSTLTAGGLYTAVVTQTGGMATAPVFYVDGKKDTAASTSIYGGTGAGNAQAQFKPVLIGNRDDLATGFSGGIYLVMVWARALSESEAISISANPWQVFAPVQRIWVPVAAGGDASVTLTGASATSGVGSLVATGTANIALTGAAATTSIGAITGAGAGNATLTGVGSTASVGTLTAFGHGNVTLTGASATAYVGAITATGGSSGAGDATLVGSQATASAGALTASGNASVTLVGAAASSAVGTITARVHADALMTGAQATAAFGTLIAKGDASVLLAGAQASSYAGSITAVGGGSGVAVYPSASTVLAGVIYGPTGVEYTGTYALSAASIATQVRTELAAELLRITEVAKIHGLVQGVNLVVTPTSRTAGDIAQTISGDGVSSSTVSRA